MRTIYFILDLLLELQIRELKNKTMIPSLFFLFTAIYILRTLPANLPTVVHCFL